MHAAKGMTPAEKAEKAARKLESLGAIRADELLPIRVFAQRLGLGPWGVSKLQQRGLPCCKCGGRTYVSGRQAVEWFESLSRNTTTEEEGQSHDRS